MKRISSIGSLLKKIYRRYSQDLLSSLQERGFIDLRPSFLEILIYVSENESPSIKEIGHACGLKKQTMTSHLNELEKRGYTRRVASEVDKRKQVVGLTDYGQKFKITLIEVTNDLELKYLDFVGDVEMDRIIHVLENFYSKTSEEKQTRLL